MPARTITLLSALALILLFLAGWGGSQAWQVWKAWRLDSFAADARSYLEANNLPGARVAGEVLLRHYPEAEETLRFLGDLSGVTGRGDHLQWRRKLVETYPDSPENWLALGLSLIRAGALGEARTLLREDWPEPLRATAPFFRYRAALAFTLGDTAAAVAALQEVRRRAGDTPETRLNLARLQTRSADPALRAKALETLSELHADGALGPAPARAALEAAASPDGDRDTALTWADRLRRHPQASLDDQLTALEASARFDDPDLPEHLSTLMEAAQDDPADVYRIAGWMIAFKREAEARAWLETAVPDTVRANLPVAFAYAESLIRLGAWRDLLAFIRNSRWQEQDLERRLIQAGAARRVQSETGDRLAANTWEHLQAILERRPREAFSLENLARSWDWDEERRRLLAILANQPQTTLDTGRLLALSRLEAAAGNSRGLLLATERLAERQPDSALVQNNRLYLKLLLNEATPEDRETARALASRFPRIPEIQATAAWAELPRHPERAIARLEPFLRRQDPAPVPDSLRLAAALAYQLRGRTAAAQALAAQIDPQALLPEARQRLQSLL
ncbi:MAG: hypothetical protein ACFE0O_15885 [Opitutales bacterium]